MFGENRLRFTPFSQKETVAEFGETGERCCVVMGGGHHKQ